MNWSRVKHTVGMCLSLSASKRANYLRKHDVFYHVGTNCIAMFRKIPLYPKLISLGDNVWIASHVTFVTHDVIHCMLNHCIQYYDFTEHIGCIDIRDNVFIGTNCTILNNITIGTNTIIAAGSLVNKSIEGNGVYGGVPAKYICSFDEFVKKREMSHEISVFYQKGDLSEKTVTEAWSRFAGIHDK